MAYPGMDNGMNAGKAPLLTPQTSAVPYAPAQQGMNANQQAIPVAQTVAGTMPSAPPLAQIQDFTGQTAAVPAGEEAHPGGPGGETRNCAPSAPAGAPARSWSPEEVKTPQPQAGPGAPPRRAPAPGWRSGS